MLFELESANNFSEGHWILIKFGGVYGECVVILPCENELNQRHVAFWRQLKGI